MSICAQNFPTDELYSLRVLNALEDADCFLFGEKSKFKGIQFPSLAPLYQIFNQCSNNESAYLGEDPFTHFPVNSISARQEVWGVLESVLLAHEKFWKADNQQARAMLLLETCNLAAKYKQLSLCVENFSKQVEALGLTVDIGGTSAPVSVILDSDISGMNANKVLKEAVPKMYEAIKGKFFPNK